MHTVADTGTSRVFTGTLVRRNYKRGQPYAQLVFKGARGTQLSLSRDISALRSLQVGQRYRVTGPEYVMGEKTFIHEPAFEPAKQSKKRWVVASVAAFVCILTGSVMAARHFASGNTVQAQSNVTAQQGDAQGASTLSANEHIAPKAPTTTTDTAVQQTAAAPAPAKPVARKTSPAPTTTTTPPPATTPAPQDPTTTPADTTPPNTTSDTPPPTPETPPANDTTTPPPSGDTGTTPPPAETPPPDPPTE